jgi:hypothetical protein
MDENSTKGDFANSQGHTFVRESTDSSLIEACLTRGNVLFSPSPKKRLRRDHYAGHHTLLLH